MRNLIFTCFSLILLFSACTRQKNRDDKMILRYNEASGITWLDPLHSERFEDIWLMKQMYNGLVRLDKNLRVTGDIAKKWDISENGLTYRFYLRDDVHFHSNSGKIGRKLEAQDFVESFFRIIDPENASAGKFIFQNLDKENTPNKLGVYAKSKHELVVKLKKPQRSFLNLLTLPYCFVVDMEAVEKYGASFNQHPSGTGPFKLKVWSLDKRLVLIKNEYYHEKDAEGKRLPYLDAVSVSFIGSRISEFEQLKKGNLEMMSGLDPSFQDELLNDDGELNEKFKDDFRLEKQAWLKTDYLAFYIDSEDPSIKNNPSLLKDVRRAIAYSINRKKLVKYVRKSLGMPANNSFVPNGLNDYNGDKVEGYKYDIAKAKKHLLKAGYDGSKKIKLKLTVSLQYKKLGSQIVSDLKELGFDTELDILRTPGFKQAVATHNAHFFRKSWTCDYPDPSNFLMLFHSGNFSPEFGPNYTHFKNEEFDRLFEASEIEMDDSKRQAMFKRMDEILIEECPVIPLFYDQILRVVNKKVSGLESNAMNQLDLKRVKIN
jgi:peptide/nickel transport system substrate-binding protein